MQVTWSEVYSKWVMLAAVQSMDLREVNTETEIISVV